MLKEIPTFDGKYFCDMSGNVYNKNKQLKPFKCGSPYFRISLNRKKYAVHRLIALTFIENPDKKPYVDHINRNPDDNRVCNLRWATGTENNMNRTLKPKVDGSIDGTTGTVEGVGDNKSV